MICAVCKKEIVKHDRSLATHYFTYPGMGMACAVKNCEFNHGIHKCG